MESLVHLAVPEPVHREPAGIAGRHGSHPAAAGAEDASAAGTEGPAAAGPPGLRPNEEREKNMSGWLMHGSVEKDGADVGGDEQIGKAPSIRFRHFDMPGVLVTVHVYPVAPELDLDRQPECTHDEPEGWKCLHGWDDLHDGTGGARCVCYLPPDHLKCSYDMDSVGLKMQTEFMICGDIDDPGSTEEWCDYRYDEPDTRPYTGTVEEILAAAEADALKMVRQFNGERDIHWDGKPF
jgi:hypothetical protein